MSLRWQFLFNVLISLVISLSVALVVNGIIRSQKKDFSEDISRFQDQTRHLMEAIQNQPIASDKLQLLLDKYPNCSIYLLDSEGKVLRSSSNRYEKQFDLSALKNHFGIEMTPSYQLLYYELMPHNESGYILVTTYIMAGDSVIHIPLFLTLFLICFFGLTYGRITYIKEIDCLLNEITSEHLEVSIPIKGKDELTQIAKSIQSMCQKLNRHHKKEEQMKKAKDSFVLNISHDLRTPLTSMIGYIDLLQSGYVEEAEYRQYISIIHEKTHRLDTLINELFEYNTLQLGTPILNKVEVSLNELLRQVAESFLVNCEAKHLSLDVKCPEEEVIIALDVNKMLRVFENLIINAIRYSPCDSPICMTLHEPLMGFVSTTFENKGEPLSEESLQHLFEAYYRGEADSSNTSNGTGLGLAIAKEIVQLHQGSLTVSNTEMGVCFRLSLPYKSQE